MKLAVLILATVLPVCKVGSCPSSRSGPAAKGGNRNDPNRHICDRRYNQAGVAHGGINALAPDLTRNRRGRPSMDSSGNAS
jgi:hypothetical protein